MPIYSYKCEKCGRVFDKFQKVSDGNGDNSKTKCIYCNGNASRLFLPAGIIFKGSGFYKTDYGSNSARSDSSFSKGKVIGESKNNLNKSGAKSPDSNKINDNKTVKEKTGKDSGAALDKTIGS
jgi:putative FmdB family regulatory protein